MDATRLDPELEERIGDARAAFVAAMGAGRPGDAAANYAPDARLLAPAAQVIGGRDAIEAFWRAGLEAGVSGIDLQPLEVDCRDGAVYEIGRYTLRVAVAEGDTAEESGSYLLVHRKQADGSWAWAIETFSPDRTAER